MIKAKTSPALEMAERRLHQCFPATWTSGSKRRSSAKLEGLAQYMGGIRGRCESRRGACDIQTSDARHVFGTRCVENLLQLAVSQSRKQERYDHDSDIVLVILM